MSDEEKEEFSQQGILSMVEMFNIVLARKKSLLFDVRPPPSEHPYATSWLNTTIDVITKEIGLDPSEFVRNLVLNLMIYLDLESMISFV